MIAPYEESDMTNFLDAEEDYHFTDIDIANDSSQPWSYPSWPSHIDHIMISNELYPLLTRTYTMTLKLMRQSLF